MRKEQTIGDITVLWDNIVTGSPPGVGMFRHGRVTSVHLPTWGMLDLADAQELFVRLSAFGVTHVSLDYDELTVDLGLCVYRPVDGTDVAEEKAETEHRLATDKGQRRMMYEQLKAEFEPSR